MSTTRMRFILSSHAPWFASSFGAQARVLAPRLVQHGLAAIHCTHGLGGGSIDWNGIRCLPGVRRPHSEPVTGEHARREASATVVALTDGREIDPRGCGPGIGFFAWTPVIGDSFHPTAAERLKRSDGVFGASAHAVRAAEKIGIEARLVPVAIDRRTMQPGDRGRARDKIGIPSDRFVLGVIAPSERIVSRRTIVAVMHAFSEFRKRRRDALLFVHADVGRTNGEGGIDLLELGASLGILDALALAPFDHVDFGIQPEEWAAIYNVLDVLVSPNITDDLGQVLLEAQACGCPAVVGDWGAMPEYHLLGEKIESEDADAVWLDAGTIARMPRVDALVAAMERAYRSGPPSDASRQSAHDRSAPFDVATVIRDHWGTALFRVAAQNEG